MELIVDNTKVSALPIGNLMDIADMSRRFADEVNDGEYGEVRRAIVVVQGEDGALTIIGWGDSSSPFELMGICEAAKLQAFADYVSD